MSARIGRRHAEHVAAMEVARGGHLTPSEVLTDARDPASPLHELYDWDVAAAAEQHWLARSREIIRTVRIVFHTETQTVMLPRLVRDPDAAPTAQGYIAFSALQADHDLAARALDDALNRVVAELHRARLIALGLNMTDELDEMLEQVAGLRRVLQAVQPAAADVSAGQPLGGAQGAAGGPL